MVPEGWNIQAIEEIAKVTSGGTPSRKKLEYWGGQVPWVRTTEVQNCFIYNEDVQEFISEEGLNNSSAKLFPKDTILLAMIGQGKTRGQVAMLKFEAATNQNCAAIIFNFDQEPEYYFNYLLSQYQNIRNLSNSAGQSNLSGALVKSIKVPVPPLHEQKKISKILLAWDRAIGVTEKLISNSQKQKKSLMQQLLTGKKRLLGFRDEWKKTLLSDVANIEWGNTALTKSSYVISGFPAFSASGQDGQVDKWEREGPGIVLSAIGARCGRCFWAVGKWTAIKNTIVLQSKKEVSDEKYLFFLLNDSKFWPISGGAQPFIGLKNARKIMAVFPPYDEQVKISTILSSADLEIETLQQKLELLKLEKKALMQQLLTGKRRVSA